jgi:hypothetical protein
MWLYELLVAASRRITGLADRTAPALIAAVLSTMAALLALAAIAKPFWHDEIYTILVARLPLATMWRAALDGIDLAPPLNTVMTRAVHFVAGPGPIATRLPPLAGFFTAAVLIFVLLRRRTNAAVALTGVLLLWFTPARDAAVEARGYGLSLGLFVLAWFGWSEAAAAKRPRPYLILMAAALALGVWSHYYLVLAFVPLAAGELVRQIVRRRFDWQPWLAFTVAGLAALPLGAIARVAGAQQATFWARASAANLTDTYSFVTHPWDRANVHDVSLVIGTIAVLELVRRIIRRDWPRRMAAHDAAAAVMTVALPVVGVLLGSFVGTYADRYVLFTVAGLALCVPWLAWCLTPKHGLADAMGLLVMAHAFIGTARHDFNDRPRFSSPFQSHPALAVALGGADPVVITGGVRYLALWYYAPAGSRGRAVYLADPAAELAFDQTDTVDRGYQALARWTEVPIRPFDGFVQANRRFLLYVMEPQWIDPSLERLQPQRLERARDPGGVLYEIRLP